MTGAPLPPPSAAERARTVLGRASSAAVRRPGAAREDTGRPCERIVVEKPRPGARDRGAEVTVEVAEAAALPVRDRILSRVRLTGTAAPDDHEPGLLRVRPRSVTLEESGFTTGILVPELLAARPDPFACCEAALLGHLDAARRGVVDELTALLDPRHLQGVVRIWPLRLDRHGLVLRVERATTHRDVRLPFTAPVATAEAAREQLHGLLAAARERRRRCRARGLPGPAR